MTKELKAAQATLQIAEAKLATTRATLEAKALERSRALIEAPQPVVVPWTEYPGYETWGMSGNDRAYLWTSPDDRSEGRYLPLYENAHDVRRMRAEARKLVEMFPVARGALQKLSDYVMGTGWDFEVKPQKRYKNDRSAKQLAAIVQTVVDDFLDYNNFTGGLDRELHEESRIDGDAFATLYVENDQVRIELTDPGCILEPADKTPLERMLRTHGRMNGWWHGVHTLYNPQLKRDDVARPLGYHAVYDRIGEAWDYLPAYRVQHIKRNVGRHARVGVTDFLTVQEDLENEGKIRRNTAVGAAILAAIVMIRQHGEGASRSSVESMVSDNATVTYERRTATGSRTTNVEQTRPGTVKDIPRGMEATVGPLGTLRSPVYIEVAQYLLRIIGQPWSMPEYLISGDASNSNYASTLVSESPFVKYCEHEQAFYEGQFTRLIWKALRLYHQCGALKGLSLKAMQQTLEISGQFTSPASRDKLQQASVNQMYVDMGIMSKRTAAADAGLDLDEEQANEQEMTGSTDTAATAQDPLNGIQVTAAADILDKVALGTLPDVAAVGLLTGLGIDPGLALRMVDASQSKAAEVQAQKDRELASRGNSFPGAQPGTGAPSPRLEALAAHAMHGLIEATGTSEETFTDIAMRGLRTPTRFEPEPPPPEPTPLVEAIQGREFNARSAADWGKKYYGWLREFTESTFADAPLTPEAVVVHRVLTTPLRAEVGGVIGGRAPIYATLDGKLIESAPDGDRLRITVPTGSVGVYHKGEFILPAKTKLRVTGIEAHDAGRTINAEVI